jgi:LysM repeat protein
MPAPTLPPTPLVAVTSAAASLTAPTEWPAAIIETATALALGTVAAPLATDLPATEPPSAPTATVAPADTTAAASATPAGPSATLTPVDTATPIVLDTTPLPPGCQALHTVAAGEWLSSIAEQYGVTWQAIAAANALRDPENLAVGQVLCIPAPGVTVTPPFALGTPATAVPPGSGLAILAFSASPVPVERGNIVRLSWSVRSAAGVSLWRLVYDSKLNQWSRPTAPAYTGSGSGELTLPVALDARQPLRFELEAHNTLSESVTAQTEPLPIACYPPFDGAPEANQCRHAPTIVDGEFQPFEHGFMLWRSDTGEVWVLPRRADQYVQWTIQLPNGAPVDVGDPPVGVYPPGFHFAEVWASVDAAPLGGIGLLRDVLGWATAPAQGFDLALQVRLDPAYSMFDVVFLSLPDGRIAQLYTGGGLPRPGIAGPAWSFVTP